MPADRLPDDAQIIARAYEDRIRDVFKTFAEGIFTGEPERDAATRFRRALASARRAYAAAIEALKEPGQP
jgi:hypothetical protein